MGMMPNQEKISGRRVIAKLLSKYAPNSGETRSRLLKAGVASIFVKICNILLNLMITVILARLLGAAGYGVYAYAFALVQIIGIPVKMGMPTLLVRKVAAYHAREDWGLMKGIFRTVIQSVFAVGVILALVSWLLAVWFSEGVPNEKLTTFGWSLLLMLAIALGQVRGAALTGLRLVVLGQFPERIIRPASFLVLILLVWFLIPESELSASSAMGLHVIAALVAFITGALILLRAIPEQVKHADARYEIREWISSAVPLSLIAGVQVVYAQAGIVILGIFGSEEEVGIYRVAIQCALLVGFGLQAFNMVLAPYFSRFHAKQDIARLQSLVTKSTQAIFGIAFLGAILLLFFGERILSVVFGIEFTAAYVSLVILILGQLVNAGVGASGILLNMTGNERHVLKALGISAALNVLLALVLTPFFGKEGAAVSSTIAVVVWSALVWRVAWKRLRINCFAFGNVVN